MKREFIVFTASIKTRKRHFDSYFKWEASVDVAFRDKDGMLSEMKTYSEIANTKQQALIDVVSRAYKQAIDEVNARKQN